MNSAARLHHRPRASSTPHPRKVLLDETIHPRSCWRLRLASWRPTRADEAQVNQVLDKAIKALGGEEKLAKATPLPGRRRARSRSRGTTTTFHGESTVQGHRPFPFDFEGEFNGNPFKALTVLSGDKGWRKFGQMQEMDPDAVKNEKRTVYLMVVPTILLPLKSKDFKVQSAADDKINGKPVAALKITGPDGKDFTLFFDKESGLPVRLVASVVGWMGEEYVQESTTATTRTWRSQEANQDLRQTRR